MDGRHLSNDVLVTYKITAVSNTITIKQHHSNEFKEMKIERRRDEIRNMKK